MEPDEPDALIDELGAYSEVSGLELDLSLPSAPRELMQRCIEQFGRVDILVNNAAHWEAGGIDRVSADQLDRHYAVNTRAAVLLCAEFARFTATLGLGRIVNITSGQGGGPMPGELSYVVTKAALDALTVTLAAELAPRSITRAARSTVHSRIDQAFSHSFAEGSRGDGLPRPPARLNSQWNEDAS